MRYEIQSPAEFGRAMRLQGGQGLIGDRQVAPEPDDGCIREGDIHHKALPCDRTVELT